MVNEKINLDKALIVDRKRIILSKKIALYCTLFAIVHFFLDLGQELYQSAVFDLVIAAMIFCCYLLNRLGFYQPATFIGLFLINVAIGLYSSVVPREVGVYLYYFPLMAISSALFGPAQRSKRYFFMMMPFLFLVLLFLTDFQVLGNYSFPAEGTTKLFFLINSLSSGFILVMCINFMLKLNATSEQQLQQLAEEVNAKNDDLERTNLELDRFLYSTSHDLRSPLSSIKGLINVARYDTHDKKIHGYFNMMTDRVERLENFIKDIIDYSKNARTELRHEKVDFNALISEVTDNLKYFEGASSIEFKNEVSIDQPVLADKTRLSVVLNNLIANAIKYHDMRKEQRWIDVKVSDSMGEIKLVVSDNGTGIHKEHQQRIFEMFYRGTLQSTGSGLGLYIVKQAVEKMKGTITVQSEAGRGASFFITVPVTAS
ncbi:HAMP domain-containing histidine kinase [Fulvivirgaceae bacterium PWU4]|uniref:histidine kinase n=1 Tax=Chryseosolibacter histidini TaxID=2782349 RepID=A0AAP2DMD2_9BACT|nr:HAMP domain-containing sensor histidine kinase [Chryseosolibacter histidini]MBT1698936.1 HAMP domain-containing histidine kinase [Chryseosolibacter histidini]